MSRELFRRTRVWEGLGGVKMTRGRMHCGEAELKPNMAGLRGRR